MKHLYIYYYIKLSSEKKYDLIGKTIGKDIIDNNNILMHVLQSQTYVQIMCVIQSDEIG